MTGFHPACYNGKYYPINGCLYCALWPSYVHEGTLYVCIHSMLVSGYSYWSINSFIYVCHCQKDMTWGILLKRKHISFSTPPLFPFSKYMTKHSNTHYTSRQLGRRGHFLSSGDMKKNTYYYKVKSCKVGTKNTSSLATINTQWRLDPF